jgi:cellulose synthase/poly-beta-1,6-N-acetylglucosamine synthase-like glycosyltransferase
MLFSIIIPVYNVERYLSDCLNSVLGQTYSDWEVVCLRLLIKPMGAFLLRAIPDWTMRKATIFCFLIAMIG